MTGSARTPKPRYAGLTDVGLVRPGNEDAWTTRPPLFAVADGLGGHQAGEIASSLAMATLEDRAPHSADAYALADAVKRANAAVVEGAREGKGRTGMGTTLTAARSPRCPECGPRRHPGHR